MRYAAFTHSTRSPLLVHGERAAEPARATGLRTRIAACMLALALGAVALMPSEESAAAWVDAEAGRASFAATTVPTPEPRTAKCGFDPGLLGATPKLTLEWRVPAGATGYTMASAEYGHLANGGLTPLTSALLGSVTVTGTPSAAKVEFNLGLLGGLLGGGATVAVRLTGAGGWKSAWLVATGTSGIAGLNADCKWSTLPPT